MGSGASKANGKGKRTGGKSIKVPLHIAVQAVVLIQSRVRIFLAKKRLEELRHERSMHENQAADYVKAMKNKNDKMSKRNTYLSRRSWSAEDDISTFSENTMFRQPSSVVAASFKSDAVGKAQPSPTPAKTSVHMSMSSKMSQRFFPSQPQQPVHFGEMSRLGENSLSGTTFARFGVGNKPHAAGNSSTTPPIEEIIYPLVGFVVKTKINETGKKLFINVTHSPRVKQMLASPVRSWTDCTHHDEEGLLLAVDITLVDVVIPTKDFESLFVYKENVGTVPVKEMNKTDLAVACIDYINHLFSEATKQEKRLMKAERKRQRKEEKQRNIKNFYFGAKPHEGDHYGMHYEDDDDDEEEDEEDEEEDEDALFCSRQFKLPRIKRNYVGAIVPLCLQPNALDNTNHNTANVDSGVSVSFLEPFRLSLNLPDHLPSVDDLIFPPEIAQDMALSWSSITETRLLPSKLAAALASANKNLTSINAALLAMHLHTTNQQKKEKEKRKSVDPDDPKPVASTNKNSSLVSDSDEDEDKELETHQKEYLDSLHKFKTGFKVYVEVHHGVLYIFKRRSVQHRALLPHAHASTATNNQNTKDGTNSIANAVNTDPTHRSTDPIPLQRPLPGGDDELARIPLAAVDLTPECDAENDLFYLHMDLLFPLVQADAEGLTKRGRLFQRELVKKTHLKQVQAKKKRKEKKKLKRRLQKANASKRFGNKRYDSDDDSDDDSEDETGFENDFKLFASSNTRGSALFVDGETAVDDDASQLDLEDLYYEEEEDDNKERNFGPLTLHHEALSETLTATHARHITRIAQHFLHPQRLTLQFQSHAELMSWILYFEQHVFYTQQTLPRYFAPQNSHHYAAVVTQPTTFINNINNNNNSTSILTGNSTPKNPLNKKNVALDLTAVAQPKTSSDVFSGYAPEAKMWYTGGLPSTTRSMFPAENMSTAEDKEVKDGSALAQRLAEQDTLYVPAQRGRKPTQTLSLGALGPSVPVTPARERILLPGSVGGGGGGADSPQIPAVAGAKDTASVSSDVKPGSSSGSVTNNSVAGVSSVGESKKDDTHGVAGGDTACVLDEDTKAWQEELQNILSPEVARAKKEALLAKLACLRFRDEIPLTAGPPQAFGCYVTYRARQPPKPLFRSARESAKITSFMAGLNGDAANNNSSVPATANSSASNNNNNNSNNSTAAVPDVELLPGPRCTVYLRLDRGFLLLYENEDMANTPRARQHLGHGALAVLSLTKQRLSVRHRRIVRMRNYMSKFTLRAARLHPPQLPSAATTTGVNMKRSTTMGLKPPTNTTSSNTTSTSTSTSTDNNNVNNKMPASLSHRRIDIVREIFLRSASGATDTQVQLLQKRLEEHIHYADAQLTLTRLGMLDDAQILDYSLRHLGPTVGGFESKTADVQVIDCEVSVTLPLPEATSDDDSDLEDIPLKPGVIERFFRVVRPPPAALFEEKEESLLQAWREQLSAQYEVFPGLANVGSVREGKAQSVSFPCTMMLFTEAKILCLFHEVTLFGVLSVRRCLEKVMTKRDRLSVGPDASPSRSFVPRNPSISGPGITANISSGVNSTQTSLKGGLGSVSVTAKPTVVNSKLYELDSSSEEDLSDSEEENSDRDYDLFDRNPLLMLAAKTQTVLLSSTNNALTKSTPFFSAASTTSFPFNKNVSATNSSTTLISNKRGANNQDDSDRDDNNNANGPEQNDLLSSDNLDIGSINDTLDTNNNNINDNNDSEEEHLGHRQRKLRQLKRRLARQHNPLLLDINNNSQGNVNYLLQAMGDDDEDSDEDGEQEVLETLSLLQFNLQKRRQSVSVSNSVSNNNNSNYNTLLPKIKQYFIELLAYDRRTYRFHFHDRHDYHLWLEVVQPHLRQAQNGNQFPSQPGYLSPSNVSSSGVLTPTRRGQNHFFGGSNLHSGMSNKSTTPTGKESAVSRAEYVSGSNSGVNKSGLSGLLKPSLTGFSEGNSSGNNSNNSNLNNSMKGGGKRNAVGSSTPNNSNNLLFSVDQEATKKYTRVLRPAEKVLGSGQVLKFEKLVANSPKQRRIMLVTDLPRLVFIDTVGGAAVRGHVDLMSENKMDLRTLDNGDFEVVVGGTVHRFSTADVPEKDAKFWFTRIRQAIAKLN